jgi:hypothetical protein
MKYIPVIENDWRRICTMPDLGDLAGPDLSKQDIVDHGFYLADDGVWHLWAAFRGVACDHLICAWAGRSLDETPWEYKGVVLRAEAKYGERIKPDGGELVCAPFFIKHDGLWNCFYNSSGVHRLRSQDGKTFERVLNSEGKSLSHVGGRDPMVLKIGDLYFCYSCVTTVSADNWYKSFIIVRTSPDLETWSDYTVVNEGGRAGNGPVSSESPFVVELDGLFYLFRATSTDFKTYVYRSDTPYHFGINDDSKLIAEFPIKAPEIILHNGQYYISDLADFRGIKLAPLRWEACNA